MIGCNFINTLGFCMFIISVSEDSLSCCIVRIVSNYNCY